MNTALHEDLRGATPLPQQAPPIATARPGGVAALRRRAAWVLGGVWLLGAMPALLRLGLGEAVPPWLEAFGWGLWLPGAGFIAVGGAWLLMAPVVWGLLQVAMLLWALTGMLAAPLFVWLGAALWAGVVAGPVVFAPAAWCVPLLGIATVAWKVITEQRRRRQEAQAGAALSARLPGLLDDLAQRARQAPDPHELDPSQLAAARTLFDLALQPVGSLQGFTRIDNFQSASLRYQLNYLSYALAALQCRYTPNFHGYLNEAQRFAIESLTLPEVCGYWKWEHLWGRLRWNADPVGTLDNVMLTGWSQIALTTYAATTGDLRYQAPGALAFRPMQRSARTHAHDAHSFTRSIVDNWQRAATTLYACEPHWVFPLCNAYAYSGLVPYDRVNGTRHAAKHHAALLKQLEADYLLPDGNVLPVVNSLTGWTWLARGVPAQASLAFLLQLCRVAHAFHPGYARRWYLVARDRFVALDDAGRLQLHGMDWASLIDAGHYRKGPAYLLSLLALAAREHGDEPIAQAALREAELRTDPGASSAPSMSTATRISLAAARLAGVGDWQTMIVRGPAPRTLQGPVLTGCRYPDVLVAAAHGDLDGLELVLYPGQPDGAPARTTQQRTNLTNLTIERLQPGARYRVHGAIESWIETGPEQHTASITVALDGRTAVRLQRQR